MFFLITNASSTVCVWLLGGCGLGLALRVWLGYGLSLGNEMLLR